MRLLCPPQSSPSAATSPPSLGSVALVWDQPGSSSRSRTCSTPLWVTWGETRACQNITKYVPDSGPGATEPLLRCCSHEMKQENCSLANQSETLPPSPQLTPLSLPRRNLCQTSNLNLSSHPNLHIKSEPASPPRDRMLSALIGGGGAGVSSYSPPGDSASSCGSSFEGSEEREDHHVNFLLPPPNPEEHHSSPSGKRIRLSEGWAT